MLDALMFRSAVCALHAYMFTPKEWSIIVATRAAYAPCHPRRTRLRVAAALPANDITYGHRPLSRYYDAMPLFTRY